MALAKSVYAVPTWTRLVALVSEHAALRAVITARTHGVPSVSTPATGLQPGCASTATCWTPGSTRDRLHARDTQPELGGVAHLRRCVRREEAREAKRGSGFWDCFCFFRFLPASGVARDVGSGGATRRADRADRAELATRGGDRSGRRGWSSSPSDRARAAVSTSRQRTPADRTAIGCARKTRTSDASAPYCQGEGGPVGGRRAACCVGGCVPAVGRNVTPLEPKSLDGPLSRQTERRSGRLGSP